jgi:uncharacterized damage-inducible protein DinB
MPVSDQSSEPWLRGLWPEVPVPVRPLFFSFELVREDLQKHAAGLTTDQLWTRVGDGPSVGFHIKHIGGSVDRLLTYLEGKQLDVLQLEYLKSESAGQHSFDDLYRELDQSLREAEARLMLLDLTDLYAPRYVGRKNLEVTAYGLLVHIAEHTQRHLGQIVTLSRVLRAGITKS